MQFRLDGHKKELFRLEANLNSNNNNNLNENNNEYNNEFNNEFNNDNFNEIDNNNENDEIHINDIKKKTNFFSKILSNINIGIEFYKQIK
jgi:hypothetical protein